MRLSSTSHGDGSVTIDIPAREAAALAALQLKMAEVGRAAGLESPDPDPDSLADLVGRFIDCAADVYFDQLREIIESHGGNPDDYPLVSHL